MTGSAVHATRNAGLMGDIFRNWLAVPLAAAAFLSLSDAFGLDVLPLAPRFLYWLALLGIGQATGRGVAALTERATLNRSRLVMMTVLSVALAGLPLTIAVWAVTDIVLAHPLRATQLPGFYLPVVVVTAAMVCINMLAQRRPITTHAASASTPAHPRILARVPPKLKAGRLLAVEAEDHYVRVHTSIGSDLVLMRFADALAELEGIEGAQVHRSWWVAKDAVAGSAHPNGKLILEMHGGTKVPVSRSYVRALRSNGWF